MRDSFTPRLKTPQEVRSAVRYAFKKAGLHYDEVARRCGFRAGRDIANMMFRDTAYFRPRVARMLHEGFGFSEDFLMHGFGTLYGKTSDADCADSELLMALVEDCLRLAGGTEQARLLALAGNVLRPDGTVNKIAWRRLRRAVAEARPVMKAAV